MGRANKSDKKSGKKLGTGGSHHHTRSEGQQEGKDQSYEDNWAIDIMVSLEDRHTYDAGRSWTIYRVPNNLCGVRKKAFLPKIISIGPFHYSERKKRLRVMEEHKMRFLVRVLGEKFERRKSDGDMLATTDGERELEAKADVLDDLGTAMKELEKETRACYSESFDDISGDDFIEMMVVDGCFVVELLRLYYDSTKSPEVANVDDTIFTTPWMLRTLQRDLLMLENQLPYFVLEKLFMLINENRNVDQQAVSLDELAVTFFDPLLPRKKAASKLNTQKDYNHLLDVFRSTFLNEVRKKVDEKGMEMDPLQYCKVGDMTSGTTVRSESDGCDFFKIKNISFVNGGCPTWNWTQDSAGSISAPVQEKQLIHFVSELQQAGVRFKKRKGHDLLDIDFTRGTLCTRDTLWIPPLSIDDNTVPLFLNFVAYEQCHERAKPFFTNYFMFWDSLVNSPGDIQILHNEGIINHVLGSNTRVANLLNNLCREIVYDLKHCYLKNTIEGLNEYCKPYDDSVCRKWWRNLIRERFSSPWTCLSLFAAIILLLLTFLQSFYIVYPYYRPH